MNIFKKIKSFFLKLAQARKERKKMKELTDRLKKNERVPVIFERLINGEPKHLRKDKK